LFGHRLGATWQTVETPHVKIQRSLLIDAAGTDDIWAVGLLVNYSYERAVIEHYRC